MHVGRTSWWFPNCPDIFNGVKTNDETASWPSYSCAPSWSWNDEIFHQTSSDWMKWDDEMLADISWDTIISFFEMKKYFKDFKDFLKIFKDFNQSYATMMN